MIDEDDEDDDIGSFVDDAERWEVGDEYDAVEAGQCGRCDGWVPRDELEALINTPKLCFDCRQKEQLKRFAELVERASGTDYPLGLA